MCINRMRQLRVCCSVLMLAVVSAACSSDATPAAPSALVRSVDAASATGELQQQLAELRQAVSRFHNINAAFDAGYVLHANEPCVPGMGYHVINPALMADGVIDPLQPEVLVYAKLPSGGYRLVAVEYLLFYDPALPTPSVFGQTFDGPMPGHAPGMPMHWDLHVWLWAHNPDGLFTAFNPTQTCG